MSVSKRGRGRVRNLEEKIVGFFRRGLLEGRLEREGLFGGCGWSNWVLYFER